MGAELSSLDTGPDVVTIHRSKIDKSKDVSEPIRRLSLLSNRRPSSITFANESPPLPPMPPTDSIDSSDSALTLNPPTSPLPSKSLPTHAQLAAPTPTHHQRVQTSQSLASPSPPPKSSTTPTSPAAPITPSSPFQSAPPVAFSLTVAVGLQPSTASARTHRNLSLSTPRAHVLANIEAHRHTMGRLRPSDVSRIMQFLQWRDFAHMSICSKATLAISQRPFSLPLFQATALPDIALKSFCTSRIGMQCRHLRVIEPLSNDSVDAIRTLRKLTFLELIDPQRVNIAETIGSTWSFLVETMTSPNASEVSTSSAASPSASKVQPSWSARASTVQSTRINDLQMSQLFAHPPPINLRKVVFIQCAISGKTIECLKQLVHLQSLSIIKCTDVQEEQLEMLSQLTQLTFLRFQT